VQSSSPLVLVFHGLGGPSATLASINADLGVACAMAAGTLVPAGSAVSATGAELQVKREDRKGGFTKRRVSQANGTRGWVQSRGGHVWS
jgi:hypothetical protein